MSASVGFPRGFPQLVDSSVEELHPMAKLLDQGGGCTAMNMIRDEDISLKTLQFWHGCEQEIQTEVN
jgi:hypothetical protein